MTTQATLPQRLSLMQVVGGAMCAGTMKEEARGCYPLWWPVGLLPLGRAAIRDGPYALLRFLEKVA